MKLVSTRRLIRPGVLHGQIRPGVRTTDVLVAKTGSTRDLLRLSLWAGLISGLLELGQLMTRNSISGGVALGNLQINRHFGWMIPAANLLIFLSVGFLLAMAGRFRPRLIARIAPATFGFLGVLGLLLSIPGLHGIAALLLAGGAATSIARRVPADSQQLRRLATATLPTILGVSVMLAGWVGARVLLAESWALARLPAPAPGAPNVLLMVMDTVRADRLSLHGYGRDTSPNLVRLAQHGVRFERARSTAPWTLPSHASMLTGRWPHELSADDESPLDTAHPTLAEFLTAHGYVTAGFVANTYFCNAWWGLGRGFSHYDDFYEQDLAVSLGEILRSSVLGRRLSQYVGLGDIAGRQRKDAAGINREFLGWVTNQLPGRPFFAFLNFFDAHAPYIVPGGFGRRFGLRADAADDRAILERWHLRPKINIPDRVETLVNDAYDDCIASLDDQLGKLFDELEQRGLLRNTLVIVTSDHGEHMGEHGLYGHGKSLYAQETHVPLLIIPPGGLKEGRSVDEPVSLRQIPSTVADILGRSLEAPFPGTSLATAWTLPAEERRAASDLVLSEVTLRDKVSNNPNRPPAWRGPMRSLVAEGSVYIRNGDAREELYDLFGDPGETRDLADTPQSTPVLKMMRETLNSLPERDGGKK